MELFYTSPENINLDSKRLVIEGDEFHHLVRVLRKNTGDRILVTDGNGIRCEVSILDISKKSLSGKILDHAVLNPPTTRVTVALSLLKAPQRFEFFLEKATELGVSAIIPMITSRTVSQPSSERVQNRLARWRTPTTISASSSLTETTIPTVWIAAFAEMTKEMKTICRCLSGDDGKGVAGARRIIFRQSLHRF